MIRHAFRTISRMPGLAAVVILSLGVGIGVNTAVFSWIQAIVLKPIPGVEHSASFYHLEPKADTGSYPGMSWSGVSRPGAATPGDRGADRVSHGAAQRRRNRAHRAHLRTARVGQLLSRRSACGPRPDASFGRMKPTSPARNRSSCSRTTTGRRVSAATPRLIGQTLQINDNRLTIIGVAPEGFQGTIMGLQFDLWVPATLAPVLVSGSTELDSRSQRGYSAIGRLREGDDGSAGHRGVRLGDGRAGGRRSLRPTARISGELRPFWKAARGPQMMFVTALGAAAGRDAPGAARGLRQHREPYAGAREHALSRSRRAAGARRRSRQRDQADAGREPAARSDGRRTRHADRLVGHRSAPRDAGLRRIPGALPDQSRWHRPALRDRPWRRQRPPVRRRSRAATRTHRSTAGAAKRIEGRRHEARFAMA